MTSFFKLGVSSEASKHFILQSSNNQIIYQNTISNHNSSSSIITRKDQVFIDFSCVYMKEAMKAFKVRSRCVTDCGTDDARCVSAKEEDLQTFGVKDVDYCLCVWSSAL